MHISSIHIASLPLTSGQRALLAGLGPESGLGHSPAATGAAAGPVPAVTGAAAGPAAASATTRAVYEEIIGEVAAKWYLPSKTQQTAETPETAEGLSLDPAVWRVVPGLAGRQERSRRVDHHPRLPRRGGVPRRPTDP
ncbi:hypothetical protein [Streptomyces yanii]|uniref:Uncharacterized protein n=1 Tax=Streptomyces yanii TaxID=78510 RepID=A0ABV5R9Q0_9ACTN